MGAVCVCGGWVCVSVSVNVSTCGSKKRLHTIETGTWSRKRQLGNSYESIPSLDGRTGKPVLYERKIQGEKNWRVVNRNHGMMGPGWVGLRAWIVSWGEALRI